MASHPNFVHRIVSKLDIDSAEAQLVQQHPQYLAWPHLLAKCRAVSPSLFCAFTSENSGPYYSKFQLFDHQIMIGENAHVSSDMHSLASNLLCIKVRNIVESTGSCKCI